MSNSCLSCLDLKQISPVLVAFEQELSRFIKYIKKKSEPGLKTKKNDEEPLARGYVHIYVCTTLMFGVFCLSVYFCVELLHPSESLFC